MRREMKTKGEDQIIRQSGHTVFKKRSDAAAAAVVVEIDKSKDLEIVDEDCRRNCDHSE